MKKMKKLLSFLLSVSFVLTLAACGGSASTGGGSGGGNASAPEAGDSASGGEVI